MGTPALVDVVVGLRPTSPRLLAVPTIHQAHCTTLCIFYHKVYQNAGFYIQNFSWVILLDPIPGHSQDRARLLYPHQDHARGPGSADGDPPIWSNSGFLNRENYIRLSELLFSFCMKLVNCLFRCRYRYSCFKDTSTSNVFSQ